MATTKKQSEEVFIVTDEFGYMDYATEYDTLAKAKKAAESANDGDNIYKVWKLVATGEQETKVEWK